MTARKLTALAVTTAALLGAAPAHAASSSGVTVCNEAENSPRGGYVVGSVDTSPPAFLRGSQMKVGNGNGVGLARAAERSPALSTCAPPDTGGGSGPF